MRALFKSQIELNGTLYKVGVNDVPLEHARGWFFDALVSDGFIRIIEEEIEPSINDDSDGQKHKKKYKRS